jgi:hypothetical protein
LGNRDCHSYSFASRASFEFIIKDMRLITHTTDNKVGRPKTKEQRNPLLMSVVSHDLALILKVAENLDAHGYAVNRLNGEPEWLADRNVYRVDYQLSATSKARCDFERRYGEIYRLTRDNSPKRQKLRANWTAYKRKWRICR